MVTTETNHTQDNISRLTHIQDFISHKLDIRILLLSVAFFWGTSYTAAKIGMQDLFPLNMAIMRFVLASALFGAILICKKGSKSIDRKDIPQFCLLGFMTITLFYYLHFTGLKYTPSTNAGLIMATAPVFAAIMCLLTKKETVTRRGIAGIAIAFTGVATIICHGDISSLLEHDNLLGNGLVVITAILWAWITLRGKAILTKYDPFVAMAYIHIFGTAFLLPFAFIPSFLVPQTLWQQLPFISAPTIYAALYLAAFCSVYAYFIWYLGVARIGAVKTAIFNYFNPVMATMAGVIFFAEHITIYTIIGGIAVIIGVYTTSKRSTPAPATKNAILQQTAQQYAAAKS